MPEIVVGDRLDRVQGGQQVHLSPPLLTEETPADGWLSVQSVQLNGTSVTLTFTDDSTFAGAANQIVRIKSG